MQTDSMMMLACQQASALLWRRRLWKACRACRPMHKGAYRQLVVVQDLVGLVVWLACGFQGFGTLPNVASSKSNAAHLKAASCCCRCRFVTAGAAVEAVGQRGLASKTQIEVIARCFNWLVWLLAALSMLEESEVGRGPAVLVVCRSCC